MHSSSTLTSASISSDAPQSETKLNFDVFANNGHIYNIKRTRPEASAGDAKEGACDSNFIVDYFGCMDDRPKDQVKVADLHFKLCEETKVVPDYIVSLGDNFQEGGVTSAMDEVFYSQFYNIYKMKKPWFIVPGNHDHGFPTLHPVWPNIVPVRVTGVDNSLIKISYQILHTYIDKMGKVDAKKVKIFSQDTLYLDELEKEGLQWIMPARYYGLRERGKLKLIVDAATFAKEYLEFYLKGNNKESNQASWLDKAANMAKNEEFELEILTHNSLYTAGKRHACPDTNDYLSEDDLAIFKKAGFVVDKGYGEIERQILKALNVEPERVYAAHDHAMYDYHEAEDKSTKKKAFHQIVAGGAGGPLQNRFRVDDNIRCFINRHGVVRVQGSMVDYYSLPDAELLAQYKIKGHHIRFDGAKGPLKELPDARGVAELKSMVTWACKNFFEHNPPVPTIFQIPYRLPSSWTPDGLISKARDSVSYDVKFADDLLNHFNRYESNNFEASLQFVKYAFDKSPQLQTFFNSILIEKHKIIYYQFLNMPRNELENLLVPEKKVEELIVKEEVVLKRSTSGLLHQLLKVEKDKPAEEVKVVVQAAAVVATAPAAGEVARQSSPPIPMPKAEARKVVERNLSESPGYQGGFFSPAMPIQLDPKHFPKKEDVYSP